jgi:hypothetical protein
LLTDTGDDSPTVTLFPTLFPTLFTTLIAPVFDGKTTLEANTDFTEDGRIPIL